MSSTIQGADVVDAVRRVSQTLIEQRDYLTSLDQAMGDGDMGITMGKIGEALLGLCGCQSHRRHRQVSVPTGHGHQQGRALDHGHADRRRADERRQGRAGPDRAGAGRPGGHVPGRRRRHPEPGQGQARRQDHRRCAAPGQRRPSARPSRPGASLQEAGAAAIAAAAAGRDSVTPLRSKIGRASWVGERTEGKVDPGCAMFVLVLEAIAG